MKLNKEIYKYSLGYFFLRVYTRLMMKFFYRKIEVRNMANIPKNAPVILAINHQNALMDAMAFVYALKKQPLFVARADMFSSQFMTNLLMFIKILPIFRIRDGAASLKNNEEVNEIVVNSLVNNCIFGIMPEGSHGGQRKLRPLKKGLFRIAFTVQEKIVDNSSLFIVPVGLEYSDYIKCKAKMFVNFGKAIKLSDYFEEYKENAPKAINKTRARLKEEMKEVMIDIQQDELYDMFDSLRKIYRPNMLRKLKLNGRKLYHSFKTDKIIIKKLNEYVDKQENGIKSLKAKVQEYVEGVKSLNFREWVFSKNKYSFIALILQSLFALVFLPVHIFGVINNYLPYKAPVWLARNVKDTQFISSFRYVIMLMTFLITYIVLISLAIIFIPVLWIKLLYIIALPISGNFAIYYYFYCKKLWAKWRYSFKSIRKDKQTQQLQKLREEIIQEMDIITEN